MKKNNHMWEFVWVVLLVLASIVIYALCERVKDLEELNAEADKATQVQSNISKEALKQVERLDRELKVKEQRLTTYEKEVRKLRADREVFSRGGRPMGRFQATWYNYNSGKTATGVPPVDGRTVAVDPDVIPLGSWLAIKFPNGKTYIRKAEDTGGAVDGNILDIYSTASTEELYRRGRTRGVEVRILRTGRN